MIHERDILLYAGGAALERYGTFVWRKQIPQFGGEELQEVFSRSDPGTYVDRDGIVRLAAAQTPRVTWLDLDGDGIREPYFLAEAARTNLFSYSEQFDNGAWGKQRASVSADQHTAPDGTTTADRLVEDTSTATSHYVSQSITATADANYALTFYAKDVGGGRNWIALLLVEGGTFGNRVEAFFNLATGAVGTSSANGTGNLVLATIEALGDGWYRCVLVGSVGNGATPVFGRAYLADADNSYSYDGDGSSYLAIWGGQFEDDVKEPSSYIATTSGPQARDYDDCFVEFGYAPQPTSGYKRFVESEEPDFASGRAFQIGASNHNADPRLILMKVNGARYYRIIHDNGPDQSATQIDLSSGFGDVIELHWEIGPDGAVGLEGALNGGSITVANGGDPCELKDAWADSRYYINGVDGNVTGFAAHSVDIVARGTGFSMDDFRALLP